MIFLAAPAAAARDRAPVLMPPDVVTKRTLQLTPGSGVFPGYGRTRIVPAYGPSRVILQGQIPIGTIDQAGGTHPVGAYDDGRGGPQGATVTKD